MTSVSLTILVGSVVQDRDASEFGRSCILTLSLIARDDYLDTVHAPVVFCFLCREEHAWSQVALAHLESSYQPRSSLHGVYPTRAASSLKSCVFSVPPQLIYGPWPSLEYNALSRALVSMKSCMCHRNRILLERRDIGKRL
jgi:hypothetical protein